MVTVAMMLALGVVMLYSIGAFAQDARGDSFFILKRQLVNLAFGLCAFVIGAMLDYQRWQKLWKVLFVTSIILLILCFVPGIGYESKGAHRWIRVLGFSFQPSELAKYAGIVFLACWFTHFQDRMKSPFFGFLFPLGVLGMMIGLIAVEVDIGTSALMGASALALMFVAGTPMTYLGFFGVAGGSAVAFAIQALPERKDRFLAFLDLEKHASAEGLQQWCALLAFGSGGIEGRGLGLGRFKMQFLPEAHNDFIFPMIGEELGLRCTVAVVFGFLLILFCGSLIAMHARDRFGMLLGFGITATISFQAIINIGVTTALLPNKGFPLPFISYGGTNLMMCLFMLGVLVNIYRQGSVNEGGHDNVLVRRRVLHARI